MNTLDHAVFSRDEWFAGRKRHLLRENTLTTTGRKQQPTCCG